MSPYLFAISMEYLSRLLNELKKNKAFKFHPKCKKLGITHMCFADDLLLFSRGDSASVQALFHCFQIFSASSGLQANLGKSSISFGSVQVQEQELIKQQLGFSIGELPFKYLGILLTTKKLTFVRWIPLIEKIVAKITSWIAKKLSYAGKTQLVQSVLFGVQAYWSQLFVLPGKGCARQSQQVDLI
ncbi:uncharacterized protein LOC132637381 [Lycium barbarum]|uniref:uncharacterized protein LOC132637381 n=1 Tax=Lycium barbarum TaxID=112863 RepID=UPI00293E39AF|nr:uncharacterized protein LOC132637381 [Lycium barbarum]